MIPTQGKERRGKTACDLCGKAGPPIDECCFRIHSTVTHWLDLCAACVAVDRKIRDGFIVGVHSSVTPQSPGRALSSISDASSAKNDPEVVHTKRPRRIAAREETTP